MKDLQRQGENEQEKDEKERKKKKKNLIGASTKSLTWVTGAQTLEHFKLVFLTEHIISWELDWKWTGHDVVPTWVLASQATDLTNSTQLLKVLLF